MADVLVPDRQLHRPSDGHRNHLELRALDPQQKFTQPPPRFTEATLVKELEENGIGRPSTYAAIINVLQTREYTEKVERRFHPTPLGRLVLKQLNPFFQDILAVDYTRGLEEELDTVEEGNGIESLRRLVWEYVCRPR